MVKWNRESNFNFFLKNEEKSNVFFQESELLFVWCKPTCSTFNSLQKCNLCLPKWQSTPWNFIITAQWDCRNRMPKECTNRSFRWQCRTAGFICVFTSFSCVHKKPSHGNCPLLYILKLLPLCITTLIICFDECAWSTAKQKQKEYGNLCNRVYVDFLHGYLVHYLFTSLC